MGYLLALILPISFFYSPRIEKSNIVLVTKPLTITQERNTPAYTLFQQTQIVQKANQNLRESQLRQIAQAYPISELSTETVTAIREKPIRQVSSITLGKTELVEQTDTRLALLLQNKSDALLNSTQPAFADVRNGGALIRGEFELKDGVGIVDHIVLLKRVFEGQAFELGQVDLKAGQYQISVGAFEGEIVAEVKDRSGLIIGEDRQRIVNLKRSGQFFLGPTLKLGKPSAFALNLRNVDGAKVKDQNLQASLFSGFYDLKKTTDVYSNVSRHSSTLAVVKDNTNKNATTLSVRSSSDKSDTVMFASKWITGALAYLSEQLQIQYLPETGMAIGRIVVDGKSMSGVQVVIENQPGLEPYYLDQFLIPDTHRPSTSENGYFILPGLNPGVYEVSAYLGEQYLGTQQYLVETQVATYQEIYSSSIPHAVITRSFDAFTGETAPTEIFVPGQKDIVAVEDGAVRYRQFTQYGLTEIVNRPLGRDYSAYVYLQSHTKDHLHLPQIKESFVDYVREQLQLNIQPETSILIGFTPQNELDVHIADENFNRNNLIFFDGLGNLSSRQVPGGGFIIFNISEGLQEVILQDKKTDRSFSSVFYSRPSVLFVSHFAE